MARTHVYQPRQTSAASAGLSRGQRWGALQTIIRFTRSGWESRRADFDLAVQTIVDGIRAGRFFQRPGECARGPCAFDLACGAERTRWADAKRADPAVLAHEALEGIE